MGKKHDYYPENPAEAYRVDSALDALSDLFTAMYKFAFEADEEKKKAAAAAFVGTTLPAFFAAFEKRLVANVSQHYLVGEKMTIADFGFASLFNSLFLNEGCEYAAVLRPVLEAHENCHKYALHLNEDLAAYLAARPSPRPF